MVSMLLDTVATLAINHIQQIGRGWALTVHGAPIPSSTQRLISDRRARQCISSQHCFAPGTCHTFKIAGPQTTHKVSFRGKRASTQVSDVYIGLLCLPLCICHKNLSSTCPISRPMHAQKEGSTHVQAPYLQAGSCIIFGARADTCRGAAMDACKPACKPAHPSAGIHLHPHSGAVACGSADLTHSIRRHLRVQPPNFPKPACADTCPSHGCSSNMLPVLYLCYGGRQHQHVWNAPFLCTHIALLLRQL